MCTHVCYAYMHACVCIHGHGSRTTFMELPLGGTLRDLEVEQLIDSGRGFLADRRVSLLSNIHYWYLPCLPQAISLLHEMESPSTVGCHASCRRFAVESTERSAQVRPDQDTILFLVFYAPTIDNREAAETAWLALETDRRARVLHGREGWQADRQLYNMCRHT